MSYSNGKLPEDTFSHEKVIEIVKGLPGVGFKLTDNGDYDMQNKKLRNVASPQTNDDVTTKSYVDNEVNKTLKLDGSNKMSGVLDMDNRRIENVAPARHGFSDTVSSLHLNTYYMDFNVDDDKLEMQNPIDMMDQRIENVKDARLNQKDAMSYKFFTDNFVKPGYHGDIDCQGRRFYNVGNVTNEDQLTTTLEANTRFLRKDGANNMSSDLDMNNKRVINVANPTANTDAVNKQYLVNHGGIYLKKDGSVALSGNLDLGNNEIVNVKEATSGSHAVNLTQLNSELFKHLPKTGGDMTGDIRMDNNSIYEIKNVENDTFAVNRKYVNDELDKKLDKNKDFSMGNNKITSLRNPDDSNELVNKSYVDQKVSQAGGSIDLTPYLKRDGTVSVTGKFDFGDNIITKIGNGTQSTDVVNKGYIDTELSAKPNVNQVVLRDGSQDMAGNLNMSLNKIIDCGQPTGTRDVTNKDFEVGKKPDINQVILRDGSNTMTSNLDMNNQQIKNVKDATHNQDAITLKQVNDAVSTISTENNKYTDQKIAENHISTHENRKNVLAYAMDDGEFTEDAGIQDVNLIDFNDMPHKTNKKAFSMKVQRTNDGSSKYKGRFDFNLFKLIRDNFSDHYTVCLETYFQKSPFYDYEFGSTVLSFEALNINIDTGLTVKVNSEYKYLRTILNLSPDGTSKQIQRRLYVNFKSNFDNSSPVILPIFVLIYGIKGEAKNDLDMTIYDYEKAYEVANNEFQLHIPLEMNNNKITGLSAPIGNNDAVTKKYLTDSVLPSYIWGITSTNNASCDFLTPYGDFVLKIGEMFIGSIKIFSKSNYPIQSNHSSIIQTNASSIYNINFAFNKTITININRYFRNINYIRINFSDRKNKFFIFSIRYMTFSP